jgi:hypothetical protein
MTPPCARCPRWRATCSRPGTSGGTRAGSRRSPGRSGYAVAGRIPGRTCPQSGRWCRRCSPAGPARGGLARRTAIAGAWSRSSRGIAGRTARAHLGAAGEAVHRQRQLKVCSGPVQGRAEVRGAIDRHGLLDVLGLPAFPVRRDDQPPGEGVRDPGSVVQPHDVQAQVLAGILVLGEHVSWPEGVGAALVIGSVAVTLHRSRSAAQPSHGAAGSPPAARVLSRAGS